MQFFDDSILLRFKFFFTGAFIIGIMGREFSIIY